MKKIQSLTLSVNFKKKDKPNLFENDNPEVIEQMRTQCSKQEKQKVMLRIDDRTHILVPPELATSEYAAELRMKYKIKYDLPAKGGRKKTIST